MKYVNILLILNYKFKLSNLDILFVKKLVLTKTTKEVTEKTKHSRCVIDIMFGIIEKNIIQNFKPNEGGSLVVLS